MSFQEKEAMENQPDVTSQLREAIEKAMKDGWSERALANAAGVPGPTLNRWLSGARPDMKLSSAAQLMKVLGMRLTAPKIPKPPDDVSPRKGPPKKTAASKAKPARKAARKKKK